ncbi:armadillo-type protein [Phycomyces blakesleeanus]
MRTIDDLSAVTYPKNVKAPQGKDSNGKIQYDPSFLMQFQPLCLVTSEDLSAFQNIGDEHNDSNSRGGGGMQRRQTSERGRGPRTPGGNPMDMGMFKHNPRDGGPMEMGKFSGGRILSHRAGSGGHGLPPAASGQGGMQRDGSHRGRSGRGGGKGGRHPPREQIGAPTIPLDQVVPLEKSKNRWVPVVLATDAPAQPATPTPGAEMIPQEVIVRKVKALLNKLTLEKFDSISDQIWEYAHQSSKEEDGQSLRTVIQLTFDKACDEAPFASMWAQLCRKMYNKMVASDDIVDLNVKDNKGEIVSGGNLFRKYLLNRCQTGFERGWKSQIPELDEKSSADIMMSDEYYAAVKAKRQGLGLVQFIGELFKRGMLTDRIMLECLTRLCPRPYEAEDEEAETMCKMVTTIGKDLDQSNRNNKEWMDTYFERMREMMNSPSISSRIKFMILDVMDMRKNKWATRRGNQPAPTTISQIREEAQKAKNEEKETMKRSGSSRGNLPHPVARQGSHRGGRDIQRNDSSNGGNGNGQGADGWSTVGTGAPINATRGGRTNDLSNFGKTDRSKPRGNVLGPSGSPFASLTRNVAKTTNEKKSPASDGRASPATMTNMFSALGGEGHDEEKPTERRKLNLVPRTASTSDDDTKTEEAAAPSAAPEKPKLTQEQIERRCKNIIEEYFSLRDKKELVECVKELDEESRVTLVSKMLGVVEKKAEDVDTVCGMIEEFYNENLVDRETYIKAIKPFMENYEDLIIDVPQAPKYVASILKAAKVEWSEVADAAQES